MDQHTWQEWVDILEISLTHPERMERMDEWGAISLREFKIAVTMSALTDKVKQQVTA